MAFLGAGCSGSSDVRSGTSDSSQETPAHLVDVEFRDTPVNLWNDKLEEGDVSGSSFVYGAFYDSEDGYLILNLNDAYYHYCSVPSDVWQGLLDADSHGSFYNSDIKGQYGCQGSEVPELE